MIATATAQPSILTVQAASPIGQAAQQSVRAVEHHHAQIHIASDLAAHAMIGIDIGTQTEIEETTIETGTETETEMQGETETEVESGDVPHQGASFHRDEKRTTTVLLDRHVGTENESALQSRSNVVVIPLRQMDAMLGLRLRNESVWLLLAHATAGMQAPPAFVERQQLTLDCSPSPRRDRPRDIENNYRPRSRSPRRDTVVVARSARRSPSPRRMPAPESGATSRRSSPPVHPSRLRHLPEGHTTMNERSPHASPPRERQQLSSNIAPPTGPRNGPRPPPSGPAANRSFASPALTMPSGPANAGPRIGPNVFIAPSRPRGGGGFSGPRGNYSGYQREQPAPRRVSEFHIPSRPAFVNGPPTGPRASGGAPPTGPAAYRSAASTSQAPAALALRPQRFLNDLPSVVTGGHLRTSKPLVSTDKTKKLDMEAERLRRQIEEVEIDKRARVREWERLQGETESAKIGTELAAERLRELEIQDFT